MPAPVCTICDLPYVGEAEDDEAHPQSHDQRVDLEDAHADAVDQPGEGRNRECDKIATPGQVHRPGWRRRTPAIEPTAPTERSMPPVSIASVCAPARIASGTAARMMTPAQPALTTPGRDELGDDDQDPEQHDQGDQRTVAQQRAAMRPLRASGCVRTVPAAAVMRRPPNREEAAEHDDPIRMRPARTVERFVLTPRNVMSVRIRARTKTAMIGPARPPRPPARLTPPRTTAATLEQRVRPGHRRADAACSRQREPAKRREQASQHVGEELRPADRTPLRNAASRLLPMA